MQKLCIGLSLRSLRWDKMTCGRKKQNGLKWFEMVHFHCHLCPVSWGENYLFHRRLTRDEAIINCL